MVFGLLLIHETQNDPEFRMGGPMVKGKGAFMAMKLVSRGTLGPHSHDDGQEGSTCVRACVCFVGEHVCERNMGLQKQKQKLREGTERQGEVPSRGEDSESQ